MPQATTDKNVESKKNPAKKKKYVDTNKNGTAGRPTKMTPEVLVKLESAFAYGCTDMEACLFADIGKDVLYAYEKKVPKFHERKQALKQWPVLKARKAVVDGLPEDPHLALKLLERIKKKEFGLNEPDVLPVAENRVIKIENLLVQYIQENPDAKAEIMESIGVKEIGAGS